VGKTYLIERLTESWRAAGLAVRLRKPAQSFSPGTSVHATDAGRLAAASGEEPVTVCPSHRWYALAMAPPMAAEQLRRPAPRLAELVSEIQLSVASGRPGDLVVVEGAGGVASPLAVDGDARDLFRCLGIQRVLLVADPGLGVLSDVRLALAGLVGFEITIYLNYFDPATDLHRLNLGWLKEHLGIEAFTEEALLATAIAGGLAAR
jgi:dethiobiotin synthetase